MITQPELSGKPGQAPSCLYVKRLTDIDIDALRDLVLLSLQEALVDRE